MQAVASVRFALLGWRCRVALGVRMYGTYKGLEGFAVQNVTVACRVFPF